MTRVFLATLLCAAGCGDDGSSPMDSVSTSSASTTDTGTGTGTGTDSTTATSTEPSTTADGSSSTGSAETPPEVLGLCQCLLINCHDPYHSLYGATDLEAAMACNADGTSIPLVGDGDSVECRLTACESSECEAGLGMAAPCM